MTSKTPDLFAHEAPRGQASASADPDLVRARLLAMLAQARAAEGVVSSIFRTFDQATAAP